MLSSPGCHDAPVLSKRAIGELYQEVKGSHQRGRAVQDKQGNQKTIKDRLARGDPLWLLGGDNVLSFPQRADAYQTVRHIVANLL